MRRLSRLVPVLALALAAVPAPARAQTGYPMILSTYPVGCRRGTTTEVDVRGRENLAGAYAVLFEKPGLTAEIVPPETKPNDKPDPKKPPKPLNELKLKVTAAADAPLGVTEYRVITPRGASTVGLFVIGSEPETLEKEPNNTLAQANPITLPVTVNGRIQEGEDVDCYRFQANAGQELVFRCVCAQLENKIHDLEPGSGGTHSDPILTLDDASGRELAMNDDYDGPDPLLVYRTEKAGDYVLQIRDVRYQGNQGWTYRITCTTHPFITNLYPMAGKRGESVRVTPVGYNLGATTQTTVAVPMQPPGPMDVQVKVGAEETNPVPFLVEDAPQTLKKADDDTPARATPAVVPGGLNGRIEKPNGADCFRFAAKKGQVYTFEVFARRYGSALDSFLEVLNAKGERQAENDDAEGKDSRIDWNCPSDGDYIVRITDLQGRCGPDFVYHIDARLAHPDFTLQSDDDKALIGPGGGYAMYVIAERRNGFGGEIKLSVEGLPPGVTATADRIPANMNQACVILNAPAGTKPEFSRIRMFGTAEIKGPDGKSETLRHEVTPMEEIYTPGGGRARYPVNTHVASVTEEADVTLKLSTTKLELKPGGSATVDVEATRKAGFDKDIHLDVILRHLGTEYGNPLPPGVTMDEGASKTLLSGADTKGKIVFKAAGDAKPVENVPIAVLGQVSVNFVVKVSHASEPLFLTVKK